MMWWGNCVLFVVLFHGVLCQDTNPEWLEPPTVSTTTTTTEPVTTTTFRMPTTTTTERPITYPPVTTTTIPTTTSTTPRYPPTRYPPTRYPPTRYPPTRYPPTVTYTPPLVTYPYPTTTTTKRPTPTTNPLDSCIISLSKPVVRYYSVFGMLYKSAVQCCNLCCPTKYTGQFYCRKIPVEYCNVNSNRYDTSYDSEYDY